MKVVTLVQLFIQASRYALLDRQHIEDVVNGLIDFILNTLPFLVYSLGACTGP